MKKTLSLILGLTLSAPVLAQQAYRCTDAEGRTVFQQTPCAGGEALTIPRSTATPAPVENSTSVSASIRQMRDHADRFKRQADIANSTSRINLAIPMQELSVLREQAAELPVHSCHHDAHRHLLANMDFQIQALSAFQRQAPHSQLQREARREWLFFDAALYRSCN